MISFLGFKGTQRHLIWIKMIIENVKTFSESSLQA